MLRWGHKLAMLGATALGLLFCVDSGYSATAPTPPSTPDAATTGLWLSHDGSLQQGPDGHMYQAIFSRSIYVGDELTVRGLIDPTGVVITAQASSPISGSNRGIWVNSATGDLSYYNGTSSSPVITAANAATQLASALNGTFIQASPLSSAQANYIWLNMSAGAIRTENGNTLQQKNSGGITFETWVTPRSSGNQLLLNMGSAGMIIQDNSSAAKMTIAASGAVSITPTAATTGPILSVRGGTATGNAGNDIIRGVNSAGTTVYALAATGNVNLYGNNLTNANEISANATDPVMKIDGKLYRTWAPDMVGQHVDVVGSAQLVDGAWTVDMARESAGSDLWLFYRAVATETILPTVTALSPASLYVTVEGSKLTVHAFVGAMNARFTYRLTGTRVDFAGMSAQETNIRATPTSTFIDVDSKETYQQRRTRLGGASPEE